MAVIKPSDGAKSPTPNASSTRPLPQTGRHRIDAVLGSGGMGAVYRAVNLSDGRVVALKTLEREGELHTALFEREYHTLASIQHPSVIEVYDFGVAHSGQRYYTMELLEGEDLGELAPLPWRDLCRYARDIVASLALLHARHLVHRDVSPRNVRIDRPSDGSARARARLLDFGALAPFGVASELIGTPGCMAPEAIDRLPLDGRADLFSLGGVMYHGLTGSRPFPGRAIHRGVRAAPPPAPSEHVPDIPEQLDQLVLSLLQSNPLARPAAAAEVIERLEGCAELSEDPLQGVTEGYLSSATLCGRAREVAQLRRHIERTLQGLGGVVLLEGVAGVGRSRLADESLIAAQLSGMAALRVDAVALDEEGGVIAAIARALLERAPSEATETLRAHRAVLGPLLPAAARTTERSEPSQPQGHDTVPAERRAQVQSAFVRWMTDVSARVPLMLLVDGAESCDETSAGALAALAHEARGFRLLLCATRLLDAPCPVAIEQLSRIGGRIKVRALSREGVGELVQSVFGNVPNCERLAQWLHSLAHGNPARSMDLLSHLVSRATIRYAGGSWSLPARLDDEDLPGSLEEALTTRLSELGPAARGLAELFALHQGALSLAFCHELLPELARAEVYRGLDELVAADMLTTSGQTYRLRQPILRDLLLASVPAERLSGLHRSLASALTVNLEHLVDSDAMEVWRSATTPEISRVLQAGWHYLRGGDSARAHRLLRGAGLELTHRGDGLSEAVPALEAALSAYETSGALKYERGYLLTPLTLAGTYGDFRLCYRHADEVLDLLMDASGLALAARLTPFVGKKLALYTSLAVGAVRFLATSRRRAARGYKEAVLGVISLGSAIIGTAVPLLDRERSTRTLELLRPLSAFPEGHPARIAHEFQIALDDAAWGRYQPSCERGRRVLAALRKPGGVPGLPETARIQLEVGALILIGSLEATRVDGSVHEVVEILDGVRTAVSRQTRAGSLASYHANRGEHGRFAAQQREVDVLAAQLGSTWRQDVLIPRNLWWTYTLCEDVMGLKRCVRQLEALAADAPSLADNRDGAIACYLAQRGRASEALQRFEAMFERCAREPTTMASRFTGAYARVLRLAGHPDRASELCENMLAQLEQAQLAFGTVTFGTQLEHCLATLALGKPDDAAVRLELMLEGMTHHDNPLLHGLAHRARAEVALEVNDASAAREHLTLAHDWFARTDNPALIGQIRDLAMRAGRKGLEAPRKLSSLFPRREAHAHTTVVRTALGACRGAEERLQAALDLLVSASHAERGYLYLMTPEGLRFAAPMVGEEPPESLAQELELSLAEAARQELGEEQDTMTVGEPPPLETIVEALDDSPAELRVQGHPYRRVLLHLWEEGQVIGVGAVALVCGEDPLSPIPPRYLEEVARGLYSAGDVRTVFLGAPAP